MIRFGVVTKHQLVVAVFRDKQKAEQCKDRMNSIQHNRLELEVKPVQRSMTGYGILSHWETV